MDAVEFIKERERMSHYQCHTDGRHGCNDCVINSFAQFKIGERRLIQCEQFESNNPKIFVSLVEVWSKYHPLTTE